MPSGDIQVAYGDGLDVKVKVNEGWRLFKVKVDGEKMDLGDEAGGKFKFVLGDIRSDMSVKAVFRKVHVITASASPPEAGSIVPSGEVSVTDGEDQTFAINLYPGYEDWDINVLVNSESQGDMLAYTFENADRDSDISVIFTQPGNYHSADVSSDFRFDLQEVLRVVQLYNTGAYHCDPDTEDGFAPESGSRDCTPHDSDYNPTDWRISLSELLRLIQLYNLAGYHPDENSDDGFAIGRKE